MQNGKLLVAEHSHLQVDIIILFFDLYPADQENQADSSSL